MVAVGVTVVFSAVMTFIIIKVIDVAIGLRVPEAEEEAGLDASVHGETAYVPWSGTARGASTSAAVPAPAASTEAEPA